MAESTHEPAAVEAAPAAAERSGAAAPPLLTTGLGPANVIRLQRAAGNAAVVRALGRVPIGQAARRFREARRARIPPAARLRLPTADELKSIYTGGLLDQKVVEDAVLLALERMDQDIRLRTGAADTFKQLVPSAGTFDEDAFKRVIGEASDKGDVYASAADANAKLKPADITKIKDIAKEADKLMAEAMADDAGLKAVFGAKADVAKVRYGKARDALKEVLKDPDKNLDTDYNRDDPQTGLLGWALFKDRHIHLAGDVAEVADRGAAILTLIHECTHLAHPDVEDHGYYGTPGFEGVAEDVKVNNAAHYEELPARALKRSKYSGQTFTPGTSGGKPATFEDEVRRATSEYFRKSLSGAIDWFEWLRKIAVEQARNPLALSRVEKTAVDLSKRANLTIHKQKPKPQKVTTLDLVLLEGAARQVRRMYSRVSKGGVNTAKSKEDAVDELIVNLIGSVGKLTGDPNSDRLLVDFFAQ